MANIYFGKFAGKFPEQVDELFYAAGSEGNEWYGGIKPGDYVFPIFQGKVKALWKVKEYGEKENRISKDDKGVVFFEIVREYNKPLRLADEFIRYKYFELDLNLLNKSAKSVRNCGFLKIQCAPQCPRPELIEFSSNLRNIYIAYNPDKLNLAEGDICVSVNSSDNKIKAILKMENGALVTCEALEALYREKSPEGYSLNELLSFAKIDNASRKEKYLRSVLSDLEQSGYFVVQNPIHLYDDILVGRKKTASKTHDPSKGGISPSDLEESDIEDIDEELTGYEALAELLHFNPNLILYGPPGTGKTYASRRIVEAFEKSQTGEQRSFTSLEKEGRAKFITFHQSYSYEEFIEGIRPEILDDSGAEEGGGDVKYRITDGILKQIAKEASMQVIKSMNKTKEIELIQNSSRIWKVSLGARYKEEQIYSECIEKKEIAIGWLEDKSLEGMDYDDIYDLLKESRKGRGDDAPNPTNDASSINALLNEMSVGDIVLIYEGPKTIRDIGVVKTNYYYKKGKAYPHRRGVAWLKHLEEPKDIFKYNGYKRLTMKTIYELNRIDFTDLLEIMELDKEDTSVDESVSKPYYLIIDEINRGNISKIFGELITLIEKDKRGTYYCTLPYSKKNFTLPANLFIIGTMNTADKSIALLDTALRRRFSFVEIEPDLTVFDNPNIVGKINEINLAALLGHLNREIMAKLDRDHRIGHSYFLDIDNLKDLYHVWYYKIIPLLMEYFYGDVSAVREIIGKDFLSQDGQIQFLDMKRESGADSTFEIALLKLCSGGN